MRFSNNFALDRLLGWKGIMVEASPASYGQLVHNRPGQVHINAAVCAESHIVHFLEHPNNCCRGIAEFMDARYRDQWYPGLSKKENGWTFTDPKKSVPIRPITCVPLKQLLAEAAEKFSQGVRHIDFFSLDVEGAELDVLRSIDFSDVRFDVIVVEDLNGNVNGIEDLLQSNGYAYHGRVEWNKWFVRHGFNPTKMLP